MHYLYNQSNHAAAFGQLVSRVATFTGKLLLIGLLCAGSAHAQSSCDAVYSFDGNLSDSSGNGYDGAAFGRDGQIAAPTFGEGIKGQAILFDGSTAVATNLDLHFDGCPQVTITGWLRLNTPLESRGNYIFSTGAYGPLGVWATGRTVVLRGRGNGLQIKNALRDERAWFFFAGVYDFAAGTFQLRFRNRTIDGKLAEKLREPEGETFFGARDSKLTSAAKNIYLDEVHIFGRKLDDEEIGRVAAQVTGQPWVTAIAHLPSGMQADGTVSNANVPIACEQSEDCPDAQYCALEHLCHPNSHLPMANSADSGMTLAELQAEMAQRNADVAGDLSTSRPPLPTSPSQSTGRTVDEMAQDSADRNADVVGGVERDEPPIPIARPGDDNQRTAGVSTGGASGGDAPPRSTEDNGPAYGGTLNGKGSLSVEDYVAGIPIQAIESGDTRECKSATQRMADLATEFRDRVIELVRGSVCNFAKQPVASMAVASGVEDPSVYETKEFQSRAFTDMLDACTSVTPDIVYLPDAMLSFWNNQIANNNWPTIGPRSLVFEGPESGNLIGPGDRTFISTSPWGQDIDPALSLDEFSGRGRVNVTACAIDPITLRYTKLREFEINDTREKRQDEREDFLYTLPTRFSFISVYLDGRSTPDRHWRYTLRVGRLN